MSKARSAKFLDITFFKGKKLHWLRCENLTWAQISDFLGLFWSKSDQFWLFKIKKSDYLNFVRSIWPHYLHWQTFMRGGSPLTAVLIIRPTFRLPIVTVVISHAPWWRHISVPLQSFDSTVDGVQGLNRVLFVRLKRNNASQLNYNVGQTNSKMKF